MNLAESTKFVLKSKGQDIFSHFWKEDFKSIFGDMLGDVFTFARKRKGKFSLLTFKQSIREAKTSAVDTITIFREVPTRVNEGFRLFSRDMMSELDKLPDNKQKTKFCMKILAALSKLAVSFAYGLGVGNANLLGVGKIKNPYSRMLMSKIVFKMSQAFLLRFVEEIEKQVEDPEELKNLRSFKNIVLDDTGNAVDKVFDEITDSDDPAFKIVENLKNYILHGDAALT